MYMMLAGGAPGPRDADHSGTPFVGDAAGRPVYRILLGPPGAAIAAASTSLTFPVSSRRSAQPPRRPEIDDMRPSPGHAVATCLRTG
ncbi:hypothetical protein tb265_49960 [Gemmatimonadetes bacterium T265]|nr:hypothetical protein tb265_49960 [Gemmatimonadetes bacterium T265]